MITALIIVVVTAVGILVVLAVVARVLGHPLITRTHVNGSLVDISLWNRKESESDKEFERRAQSDADGVTGFDIDNAGEADVTGISGEADRSSTIVRRWSVKKLVRREDFERIPEGCDQGTHGEPAVQGCGDDGEFRTAGGSRREHGSTTPKRIHGYLTKWNEKYGIYTGKEGLWNEKFGEEYKD